MKLSLTPPIRNSHCYLHADNCIYLAVSRRGGIISLDGKPRLYRQKFIRRCETSSLRSMRQG
jgi:hypothetical protein